MHMAFWSEQSVPKVGRHVFDAHTSVVQTVDTLLPNAYLASAV